MYFILVIGDYMNNLYVIIGIFFIMGILFFGCTEQENETDNEKNSIEDVNEDNKENTIEDNKENMDLTECGEGTKLEIIRCYKEKAVEYKLPEICDNLEEEAGIRTQCYINYIKKTDDLSQCINVDESFDFQKICEGKY